MLTELPIVFGDVLKAHRNLKGWSQMKLAAEAGLHINALGKLERGQRGPTLHTVLKLAKALGIPAAKLVAEVEKIDPRL